MFEEPSVRPGNALVFVDVHDFGADSLQGSTAFVAQAATRFDALQVLLNLTYEIALLRVRAHEQFTREQMTRIALQAVDLSLAGLRDADVQPAMSIGQFSEIFILAGLGFFLRRVGFRSEGETWVRVVG